MLALSVPAFATPDHVVDVDEELLGSNEAGFLILRTVRDNLGSYFSTKTTVYLDEYEKKAGKDFIDRDVARTFKSTLVSDVRIFRDYGPTPSQPKITETIETNNKGAVLSDLLIKYPQRGRRWSKDEFAKLIALRWDRGDIRSAGKQFLTSFDVCESVFQVERNTPWEVEEAREDSNCVYLRLTTGGKDDDESQQSRWICLLPETTRQLHAHLKLKPWYLVSRGFKSMAEAVDQARQIYQRHKDSSPALPALEVWSVHSPDEPGLPYRIAVAAEPDMTPAKFEWLRTTLGKDLAPIHSGGFEERFPVGTPP
ncbi:hypothetical protein [Prosthecobacter sp.]